MYVSCPASGQDGVNFCSSQEGHGQDLEVTLCHLLSLLGAGEGFPSGAGSHTLCHSYGAVTVHFFITVSSELFLSQPMIFASRASNSPLHPAVEVQCMVWGCFDGSTIPEPQLCVQTHKATAQV